MARSERRRRIIKMMLLVTLPVLFGMAAFVRADKSHPSMAVRQPVRQLEQHPPTHRVPRIDGELTPELIPDAMAQRFFFGAIAAAPNDDSATPRVRSYIKHVIFGSTNVDPAAVAAIQRLGHKVHAMLGRYKIDVAAANDREGVRNLIAAQEMEIASLFASLDAELGHQLAAHVRSFVGTTLKRRIRVF